MAETAEKPAKPNLTGAFDLFGKSAELVQKNFNVFLILFALPIITTLAGSVRSEPSNTATWTTGTNPFNGLPTYAIGGLAGFAVLLTIAVIVAALFIQAMTYALQLEAAQGKTPSLPHLFNVAKKYWLRLFGLGIVVGVMTVIGLILFIVPGLIVIRRYFLASYALIDNDSTIGAAMSRSAALTKPYSGWIWSIIGVMILLSLPNIIPVVGGIIAVVLAMFYSVAPAIRYLELKKLVK